MDSSSTAEPRVAPAGCGSRVVLIEGLPGSGKTSLAEWLGTRLGAAGLRATWVPELQRDHPVIDRATLRTARSPGYADRCVARWACFAARSRDAQAPQVQILEGCLFQGTVRFLVEHERPAAEAERYLAGVVSCLAPLRPALVYLTQPDPHAYLRDEFVRRKDEAYVGRIARYSSSVPFCTTRGLTGMAALVALYVHYRHVCDRLVRVSGLPVLELDAIRLDEAAVRERAARWVEAAVGEERTLRDESA